MRGRAGVVVLIALLVPQAVLASPTSDDNAGAWVDDYVDNSGIDATGSSNWTHSQAAQAVMQSNPSNPAVIRTTLISPASASAWTALYLKYSASAAADIEVRFVSADGLTSYPLGGGSFALGASDDVAWNAKVDLSSVPIATLATGRAHVTLKKTGAIPPTLQALRVNWVPLSKLALTLEAPTPKCGSETASNRVRVSVSHVDTAGLVVHVPLPAGAAAPDFGQQSQLQFVSATEGGAFTATAQTVDGVTVPARSVYWRLGTRKAGTTFILDYTFRIPYVVNGTTYTSAASADAANAALVTTANAVQTVSPVHPNPVFTKNASPVYRLFGENRIQSGATVTFSLNVWNRFNNSCDAPYHRVVVWDTLTPLQAALQGGATPLDGGVYTAGGTTLYPTAGGNANNAIVIPANSIYWDLGTLAVNENRTVRFSATLVGNLDAAYTNTGNLNSGYAPQGQLYTAPFPFKMGIDYTPSGIFAVGDRIRGTASITAIANDNPFLYGSYTEPVSFLFHTANAGASALLGTTMIGKVPDGAAYVSSLAPVSIGVLRWFSTDPGSGGNPPAFGITSTDCSGSPGGLWTPTEPPSGTRWVAWCIPRMASAYFPETGKPPVVTGELTVRTLPPGNGCSDTTLVTTGYFRRGGYADQAGNITPESMATYSETEPIEVRAPVASLAGTWVVANPQVTLGPGDIDYTVYVPNRALGGADTDEATNPEITLTLPTASVNGVNVPLALQSYSAPGGVATLIGNPATQIRITYASIAPLATRTITVRVHAPRGMFDNTTLRLTADAKATSLVCQNQVTASASATSTMRVSPNLRVVKDVDLGLASAGAELVYTLSYLNSGNGVATGSWIVDRVPAKTTFVSAVKPGPGVTASFWFSNKASPPFQANERSTPFLFSDSYIRQNFTPGTVSGGIVTSPFGAATTWVAVLLDDPALSPPQLPTSTTGVFTPVQYRVAVSGSAQTNDLVTNEAVVFSNELIPAVSNQVQTLVSPNPSLAVTRTCPGVVANGEDFIVDVDYINNSSNPDTAVTVTETLPAKATFVGATVTLGGVTSAYDPTFLSIVTQGDETKLVTWDVTGQLGGNLVSLAHAVLHIKARITTAPSGSTELFQGLGTAANQSLPTGASIYSSCTIPIENPDLSVAQIVDQAEPIPDETINITLNAANIGRHDAPDTVLSYTFPTNQLAFVAGSTLVLTPGWSLSPNVPPVVTTSGADTTLTWSLASNNALTTAGGAAGTVVGSSGQITLTFKMKVGNAAVVPPNTPMNPCASIGLAAGSSLVEDSLANNQSCVLVRTPRPNPYIVKTGPSEAQPGSAVTYRLAYGNDSRMPASDVVFYDHLFDNPLPSGPDGKSDVKFLGVVASNGETLYVTDVGGAAPPAFDVANPTASGQWKTAPGDLANPVTWVALKVGALPGGASTRSVFVQVELRNPWTGATPLEGTQIQNCASIEQSGQPADGDDDADNNLSCIITKTPGIDVSLTHECSPEGAYPGVRPGEVMTLTLTVSNNGTQPSYGLKIVETLPAWFELDGWTPTTAVIADENGASAAPLDKDGAPLNDPVPWTKQDTTWYLGNLDADDQQLWYRRVALAPGQSASIVLSGRVARDIASGTAVSNSAAVATDYRYDWTQGQPTEELTDNNTDSCGTTVYRPDPIVLKFAAAADGGGSVGRDDRIEYTIAYNNIGQAVADTTVLEDTLPAGTAFVVGSLSSVPAGVTVQYANASGWGYPPVANGDGVDPNVKAFRLVWTGALPAPTNNYFHQSSAIDFERGTFSGTKVDPERGPVGARDSAKGSVTTGGAPIVPGQGTAYLSPLIPSPEEGSILVWDRIVAALENVDADNRVVIDVLDGATGTVIPGFEGRTPDGSGAIDLAGITPAAHPSLKLRARFIGGSFVTSHVPESLHALPALAPRPRNAEILGSIVPDELFGLESTAPGLAALPSLGLAFASSKRPVVWQNVQGQPVAYHPALDPEWNPTAMWAFDSDRILVLATHAFTSAEMGFSLTRDGVLRERWRVDPLPEDNVATRLVAIAGNSYNATNGFYVLAERKYPGGSKGAVFTVQNETTTGWFMSELPFISGQTAFVPAFINSRGVVAGTCTDSGGAIPCVYQASGSGFAIQWTRSTLNFPLGISSPLLVGLADGTVANGTDDILLGTGTVASVFNYYTWKTSAGALTTWNATVVTPPASTTSKTFLAGNTFRARPLRTWAGDIVQSPPTVYRRGGWTRSSPGDYSFLEAVAAGSTYTVVSGGASNGSGSYLGGHGYTAYTGPFDIPFIWTLGGTPETWQGANVTNAACPRANMVSVIAQLDGSRTPSFLGSCKATNQPVFWVPDGTTGWLSALASAGTLYTATVKDVASLGGFAMGSIQDSYGGTVKPARWNAIAAVAGVSAPIIYPTADEDAAGVAGAGATGTFVGSSFDGAGNQTPVVWSPDAAAPSGWGVTALPVPEGTSVQILGKTTSSGIIVGNMFDGVGTTRPITWIPDASAPSGYRIDVPDLAGFDDASIYQVDASGDAYWGQATTDDGNFIFAIWSPAGPPAEGLAMWLTDEIEPSGLYLPGFYGNPRVLSGYRAASAAPLSGTYTRAAIWVRTDYSADGLEPVLLPMQTGEVAEGFESIIDVTAAGTVLAQRNAAGLTYRVWTQTGPAAWTLALVVPSDAAVVPSTLLENGAVLGVKSPNAAVWIPNADGSYPASPTTLPLPNGTTTVALNGQGQQEMLLRLRGSAWPFALLGSGTRDGKTYPLLWQQIGAGGTWSVIELPLVGSTSPTMIGPVSPTSFVATAKIGEATLAYLYRPTAGNPDVYETIPLTPEGYTYASAGSGLSDGGVFTAVFKSATGYQIFAFVPDGQGGYEAVPVGDELAGYDSKFPPSLIAGSECWSMPHTLQRADIESDTGPRIWGCDAGPPIYLDDWSVLYRTDRNPTFSFQLAVQNVCQTSVTNNAAIATATPEISTANNTASVTTPIDTADVKVSLAVDKGTAAQNAALTYTVTVTNDGPGASEALDVALWLPVGVNGGSDSAAAKTWHIGALDRGATRVFTHATTVTTATAQLPLVASAEVEHPHEIDCSPDNDTASATTITGSNPNVWVDVVAPPSAPIKNVFTVQIPYGNDGNAEATNVGVTVTLPASLTLVGGSLSNALGTLAAGATGQLTLTVRADDCGKVDQVALISALITSNPSDANFADNAAGDGVALLTPDARASLAVVPARLTAEGNDAFAYTVHFRNDGAVAIADPLLTVNLPSASATVVPESLDAGATYDAPNKKITWLGAGTSLAAGAEGAVTFVLRNAGAAPYTVGATLTSAAGALCPVAAGAPDTTPLASGGVQITKSADSAAICDGDGVTWSLTVVNSGASAATGVVVTDNVPNGLSYVAGSITGPGAVATGVPTLVWNLGTLAPGKGYTLTYRTSAPTSAGALIGGAAVVEVSGAAPSASPPAVVRVDCGPGTIALEKRFDRACLTPDTNAGDGEATDVVHVTIGWRNTTQQQLTDVSLRDWVPDDFVVVGAPAGYEAGSRRFTVTIGTLGAAASGSFSYDMRWQPADPNTARYGSFFLDRASIRGTGVMPQVSNAVSGVILDCRDSDPCTHDSCSAAAGCVHTVTALPNTPDLCDGDDDDCDGAVDEDYTPSGTSCGQGACAATGMKTCVEGAEHDSCQPGAGSAELCDGIDNNCDGNNNEGLGLGDGCTGGVGACLQNGVKICGENGSVVCSVSGGTGSAETCDGIDNDCNGTDDDGLGLGESCEAGSGACLQNGVKICGPGNTVVCSVTGSSASPEACDGVDNDCDGLTDAQDDSLVPVVCEEQRGVCAGSLKRRDMCITPEAGPAYWQSCDAEEYAGQAYPSVYSAADDCDGENNDCDDATDEDFDGSTVSCGLGVCSVTADEVCVGGLVKVQRAQVVTDTCVAPQPVSIELCGNTLDDDCNGVADLDFAHFAQLGDACDSTAQDRNGGDADLCAGGVFVCDAQDLTKVTCNDDTTSIVELCDLLDNDCDGPIDEPFFGGTFKLGEPCDGPDGDLCVEGVFVCTGDKAGTVCSDQTTASAETCNGKDDDCDALTDEAFANLGASCDSNTQDGDSCANDVVRCSGDGTTTVCVELIPARVEVCNGLDDDCNEGTDEGLDFGSCTAGTGICFQSGRLTCTGGGIACSVTGGTPKAKDECGNALDDDCDGGTDEGFELVGEPCDADDSNATIAIDTDLCHNDVVACDPDDNTTTRCVPVAFAVETCDGQDDDCDGSADETFTYQGLALGSACDGADAGTCKRGIVVCDGASAATCDEAGLDPTSIACSVGLGACARTGFLTCDSACNAPVVAGSTERCDNAVDDDCDGDVNEGFPDLGQDCDSNTTDTDLCKNDKVECLGTTTGCVEKVAFQAELCDRQDNDCDGDVDETFLGGAFALGEPCDGDDEDACAEGEWVCDGPAATRCDDDSGDNAELCNGIDDDCDTQVDETWPTLGEPCDGSNDADFCARGRIECNLAFDGTYCHEEDRGVAELCNGRDDTCDCDAPTAAPGCVATVLNGMVDEGFDIGATCVTDGLGVCRATGRIACAPDDNTTSLCVASAEVQPQGEICNGLDDDCDGEVDNPGDSPRVCNLETDILTGPPAVSAEPTATFTYVNPLASPPTSHTAYQCSLDGGAWVTCDGGAVTVGVPTSPLRATPLDIGTHTLLVRATSDNRAVVDTTPDYWIWGVDDRLPDTLILSGPTSPSQTPDGTFVFGSPTPDPDFYSCVLDPAGGVCPAPGGAGYRVCATPYAYSRLADGAHTICVYVTDKKGTPDPIPASYTWLIDTTPPETEIVPPLPPDPSASTSVIFHYIDPTEPATNTFECSLDGAPWTDCDGKTIDYEDLYEGEHTFQVRTVDPHGLVDPTPATYTWDIDHTAPCPTIAVFPSDPAQSSTAVFGFTASEPGASFRCVLDPRANQLGPDRKPLLGAYAPCDAVTTFAGLADGAHTLWVYAIDAVGNVGTCRDDYRWVIDTSYPETVITSGPPPLTGRDEVVIFEYIDPTDPDALTFECRLDGAATWTRCDGDVPGEGGTTELAGLPVGEHTFEVRACDFTRPPSLACDPTPATVVWEVTSSPCPNDRTAPSVDCAVDLVLECADDGALVDFGALATVAEDACEPVAVKTSANAEVSVGQTPLVFVATDGNGNMSSCVTLVSVVDTTAPDITCPADVLDASTDAGLCSAAVDFGAAHGDDRCQGEVGLLALAEAPDVFPSGETRVTHRLVDAFGNVAACVQKVVVTDREPLVITCSESATVDAAPDRCDWTGVMDALATDNCSGTLAVDVEGTWPVGSTPVLFTAADEAGNSDQCTTTLTVRDVTAPLVDCGTPVGALPTLVRAAASDACGAVVTLENVSCTSIVGETRTPLVADDCPVSVTGDTLQIDGRLEVGRLEVHYDARAIDPSGNVAVVPCEATHDPDRDRDGIVDRDDNCVETANGDQGDTDADGIGDLCDVCPAVSDPDQADGDDDGIGDACSDKDEDGILDHEDNCVLDPNADQRDGDDDGIGDACEVSLADGFVVEGGCAGGGGGLVVGLVALIAMWTRRLRGGRRPT